MIRPGWPRWLLGLSLFCALLAVGYLVEFLILAFLRSIYPYELEWIEGATVDQVLWILRGKPLYAEPTIYFLPATYNPLYYYISAGAMKILGAGFFAPRLVSILAAVGCFVLLYWAVFIDTDHSLPGILAAGLFAATYRFAGAWLDLAKTDSLFLFLILAAFLALRKANTPMRMVGAGLIFVLAYFTKQLALPVAIGLAFFSLLLARGKTWPVWATAATAGFAVFFLLDYSSAGWYSFYTLKTVAYHDRVLDILPFWKAIWGRFWPAMIVGLFYPFAMALQKPGKSNFSDQWLNIGFGIALVAASWSIFFKIWTYDNGYLLACLGLAMLAGLGLGQGIDLVRDFPRHAWAPWIMGGLLGLLIVQFALLFYKPLDQLPTPADRETEEKLVQRIRELPGEVWVFNRGYIPSLAGKITYLNGSHFADVISGLEMPAGSDQAYRRQQVSEVFNQAVIQQHFDWVIIDKPESSWAPYYLFVEDLFNDSDPSYPVTGARSRPESLMAKNPFFQGGALPLGDPVFNALFAQGWGPPHPWGRQATDTPALVKVALDNQRAYQILVTLRPGCNGNSRSSQSIKIVWNDHLLGQEGFSSCNAISLTYNLPQKWIKKEYNQLSFKFEREQALKFDSNTPVDAPLGEFLSIEFLPGD